MLGVAMYSYYAVPLLSIELVLRCRHVVVFVAWTHRPSMKDFPCATETGITLDRAYRQLRA
jgi:hypothetical protein